jgi:hypothetical protein
MFSSFVLSLLTLTFVVREIPLVLSNPLDITVTTEHASICVLEGVPVTVTLKNRGDTAIRIDQSVFEKAKLGSFRVVPPNGEAFEATRLRHRGFAERTAWKTLEAGAEWSVSFLLSCEFHEDQGSIFRDVGLYNLVAQYDDGELASVSAPINVQVVDPPEEEAAALALVKTLRHPDALYEPDVITFHRETSLRELEALASMQNSKVYARYARLGLAWRNVRIATGAGSDSEVAIRQKAIQEAQTWLDRIDMDGFTLASKARELQQQLEELKAAPTGPAQQN